MKQATRLIALLLLVFAYGAPLTSNVGAQQPSANGVTVSPGFITLTVDKEHPEARSTLTISNSYESEVSLSAELFAIDEEGARLIPSGKIDKNLAEALTLSAQQVSVPAGGSAQLGIIAKSIKELASGGHYASLVLTELSTSKTGSTFHSAVAVNVFLIQSDGVKLNLQLSKDETANSVFSLPSKAALSFYNGGNTHIVPRASVGYYDGETLLGSAVINTGSKLLFPERTAKFEAPLRMYDKSIWPRRITQVIRYRVDGTETQQIKQKTFWYVPLSGIVTIVAIGTLLLWQRRKIRLFVRWIYRQLKTLSVSVMSRRKRGVIHTKFEANNEDPTTENSRTVESPVGNLSNTEDSIKINKNSAKKRIKKEPKRVIKSASEKRSKTQKSSKKL